MNCATVYKRKNKFYIHSMSKTVSGFWILGNPIFEINENESITKFGKIIIKVLESSIDGVENPPRDKNLFSPILELAKIKSWNTFVKSTRCVEVERENETIQFIPTINLGSTKGFKVKKDGVITIENSSFEKVGICRLN